LDRLVGHTGWHTCGCPIGPTGTQGCTQAIGCPGTSTCLAAAAQAVGPTGTQGCTQPGHCLGPTGTQGCTQPPHCLGQTGWHTCVCPIGPAQTMLGCPPTHMLGCPPTSTCPPTNHLHLCPNTHFSSCVVESFACPVTVPCPTRSPVCHPSLVAICPVSVACGIKSAEALAASPNNPTASTRCFICPPIEQAGAAAAMVGPTGTQGCTQPGHCVGQTGWFTCGCPPEVAFGTAATICTQALGCPRTSTCPPTNQVLACADTRSAICQVESAACPPPPPMTAMTQCFHCVDVWTRQPGCEPVLDPGAQINPTASTRCFICPPIGQAGGVAAAALLGPTGTQGCTQPGHCVGQTGWHTCGCPIGPTGTQGCTQICGAEMNTAATVCRPHTSDPGCPNTSTCTPQGDMPPTLVCAAAMVGPTGTQGCTQPGHCVGQTGWHTCGCPPQQSTAATLCTRYHCPIGQTGWHTCGCPVITLVTYSGCPGPSAVDACPTRLCMTIAGPCLPYTMGGCG
jgi:hypothetical protein